MPGGTLYASTNPHVTATIPNNKIMLNYMFKYNAIPVVDKVEEIGNGSEKSITTLKWDGKTNFPLLTKNVNSSESYSIITENVPAYFKYNQMSQLNMLTQNFQKTVFKDTRDLSNVATSNVTTWNSSNNIWRQEHSYTWNSDLTNNKSTQALLEFPVSLSNIPLAWKRISSVDRYDDFSHPIETRDASGVKSAQIYGYNNCYPIASVLNSPRDLSFACNFEVPSDLSWSFSPGSASMQYANEQQHTGEKSGKITNSTASEIYAHSQWQTFTQSLSSPTKFVYSGWVYSTGPTAEIFFFAQKNGTVNYEGAETRANVVTSESGKWVFLEGTFIAPAGSKYFSLRVDNNGNSQNSQYDVFFDDLRFHPADAAMNTMTYDSRTGKITSLIDNNSIMQKFEYDSFARLIKKANNSGQVVMDANYHEQPEIYSNHFESTSEADFVKLSSGSSMSINRTADGIGPQAKCNTIVFSPTSAAGAVLALPIDLMKGKNCTVTFAYKALTGKQFNAGVTLNGTTIGRSGTGTGKWLAGSIFLGLIGEDVTSSTLIISNTLNGATTISIDEVAVFAQ